MPFLGAACRRLNCLPLTCMPPIVLLYSSRALAVFERGRPFGARNFVRTFVTVGGILSAQALIVSHIYIYIYIYIYISVLYYSFRLQHYEQLCLDV